MAFNLTEFRAAMTGDGARPNLFNCQINFPVGVALSAVAGNNFRFMARAAQLPGATINQVPVMYFGRELKFAGNRIFQDWTVTIINDENFFIRKAFEDWMSAINEHVSNVRRPGFLNTAEYTSTGYITQYGKEGATEKLKKYKFVGLFPVDITPIELDWGANDQIEEFAVTFAYQWWEDFDGLTTDRSDFTSFPRANQI
jgi:hypothetical protein